MQHKKGINLEDVQEMNRALVIRLLRRPRTCSRELAKMTGLKQATIANIIGNVKVAENAVQKAPWRLSFGLAGVVNAFNPDTIIIGDEMAQLGKVLLDTVRAPVASHVIPTVLNNLRIELSSLGNDPVLVGVRTLAVERILHKPSNIPRLTACMATRHGKEASG